jgi:hypothetical protein
MTCRDPASALDLAEIAEYLNEKKQFDILWLAQNPAANILKPVIASKFGKQGVSIDYVRNSNDEHIENFVRTHFYHFEPNIVLTGISGPGSGIDEVTLKIASEFDSVKTASIQSYWGDVNPQPKAYADTIFVIDEFARQQTIKKMPDTECVITGPFRWVKYANFDMEYHRLNYRRKLENENINTIIAFFGQPFDHYDWYQNIVHSIITIVKENHDNILLVYKPHPKESVSFREEINNKYQNTINFKLDNQTDTDKILAGIDVSLSCFSTTNFDLQMMLANSKTPYAVPVYLYYDEKLKNWFEAYTQLKNIPFTSDGKAVVIDHMDNLSPILRPSVLAHAKLRCHEALKTSFKGKINPSVTIAKYLEAGAI